MKPLETQWVRALFSEQWTVISLPCPYNYQTLIDHYYAEGYDDLVLEDDINRYLDYRTKGPRIGQQSREFLDRLLAHSFIEEQLEVFWLELWTFLPSLPISLLVVAYAKPVPTSRVDIFTKLRLQSGSFPGVHARPQLQSDFDSYRRIRLRSEIEAGRPDAMERSSGRGFRELELPPDADLRPDGDLL